MQTPPNSWTKLREFWKRFRNKI